MRKKVDARIRTLVENGVRTRQRSLFVVVGDKGRDQVVNLHYMLSKAVVKARPSVLWCYKKDLYLSSHKKKRMKQIKTMMQRGLLDPEKDDPFSLFVASTNIRYCYYAETHKILGNTYGMCVLQDFEALTPNLLARTIETVEGGGIVVLLLSSLNSLTKLYNITMDVHARFRTESHADVVARFNERFLLSLAACRGCVVMDDELNILPVSTHIRSLQAVPPTEEGETLTEAEQELRDLKLSLKDTQPVGSLIDKCRTLDQAKAVITFLDAVSEKTLRSTVALTASRGRGKSAALGLAMAGAVALGYSNIFVTSPSPENLKTLFEFVFKGFDAMDYKEHIDYELVESTNPSFNKAIVRVNVFRQHRQTIQYIQPQHHERLAQAELLVIDEAAAIPLPVVKKLLGPYLVFMCSTINGYEGTGRSLSLKLIQQLREQSTKFLSTSEKEQHQAGGVSGSGRVFKEVELAEPIRYASGDVIESWLNELLCLDAAKHIPHITGRLPHPGECDLYYVNRDTLFSFHKASEAFLQRMMALYVASHYKNTPNDLQMISDAPAHHLFVLLGPVDETKNALPDILCVVQVCLEGEISKQSALKGLSQGFQPQGDLIPWTISQQFQDAEFPRLSGARIVRIACHPDLMRAGYGGRAVELLSRYFEGQLTDLSETELPSTTTVAKPAVDEGESLLTEQIKPRSNLPPLLMNLSERRPEHLQYVGTSSGLTQGLFNFWRKHDFQPVYLRQTPNDITGEHTCIMLRPLRTDDVEKPLDGDSWLAPFAVDFKARMRELLGFGFKDFPPALALSILDPRLTYSEQETNKGPSQELVSGFSPYDLKRLDSYSRNLVDYHMVLDLVPSLARGYFAQGLPATLSYGQAAILLSLGLQRQELEWIEKHLKLPSNQLLALFNKAIRKLTGLIQQVNEKRVESTLPAVKEVNMEPHPVTVDEELNEAAREVRAVLKDRAAKLLDASTLSQYSIGGREKDLDAALETGARLPASGRVSVKSSKKREANGTTAAAEDHNGDMSKSDSKKKKQKTGKKQRT
eukprot:jgi/Chlat1/317/Chrsp1S03186